MRDKDRDKNRDRNRNTERGRQTDKQTENMESFTDKEFNRKKERTTSSLPHTLFIHVLLSQ